MSAEVSKKAKRKDMRASKGFTLIEMAVAIMIVAVLATFAAFTYSDVLEAADASLVDAAQASIQAVVSQASARMDVNPTALPGNAVANAVRVNVPDRALVTSGGGAVYNLNINNTGRGARYQVGTNGDVVLISLSGFSNYTISANGTIYKN